MVQDTCPMEGYQARLTTTQIVHVLIHVPLCLGCVIEGAFSTHFFMLAVKEYSRWPPTCAGHLQWDLTSSSSLEVIH